MRVLKKPCGVVINKAGAEYPELERYLEAEGLPCSRGYRTARLAAAGARGARLPRGRGGALHLTRCSPGYGRRRAHESCSSSAARAARARPRLPRPSSALPGRGCRRLRRGRAESGLVSGDYPETRETDFKGSDKAKIDENLCIGWGKCAEMCRFGAISPAGDSKYAVDELRCEGCGPCTEVCPAGAARLRRGHRGLARVSGDGCSRTRAAHGPATRASW
ncbi:MAG: ATP-binding protein [Oscillospiraceae bacterium]